MEACDTVGVIQKGYDEIYALLIVAKWAKRTYLTISSNSLEHYNGKEIYQLWCCRHASGLKSVNANFSLIEAKSFEYNSFNNIYVDVEML